MLSRLFFAEPTTPQKRKPRPLACDTPPRETKKARINAISPKTKMEVLQEDDLVGSVHESDAAHWMRHSADPSSKTCCRCNYIRNKAELHREHPWLKPRPSFMGGRWRLGCDCCKWMYSNSRRETHPGRRGCKLRASIFANFNFVCNADYRVMHDRIRAHSAESGHRVSAIASHRCSKVLPAPISVELDVRMTAMVKPMARPSADESAVGDSFLEAETKNLIAESTSKVLQDSHLLKGRVPQCQDWLDAWVESTEQIAFHKQARCARKKKTFRDRQNLRRIRRKQVRIMAEARREVIRKQLGAAQFISLSMDERQYQKIVRFRCDAPSKPFFCKGILGVMCLQKSAVGDFEEDHALSGVRQMDAFLNKFCTPIGPASRPLATDIALKEHIRKTIRVFAADGASKERRALLLATQELFPNVVLLLRDSAHALRIAVRDPLHIDALFGDVWTHLFDKRHALVPDVMNSKKWQDLLQNIQRVVLRIPSENQPLAVVLKHLRFAKQRFDSSADPIAKVALMLLPLATMLAFIGSDERHKPCDRARAKETLKKLDSKFALAIGVCADWGLVTQAFLRLFDKNDHDIAKTYGEIRSFKITLKTLFDQGGVFSSRSHGQNIRPTNLPAIGGYFGAEGVTPKFITQHIEETLRRRVVFNCGDEQVLLWGSPKTGDVQEIAERMKFVTAHVIDRVEAELQHLACFSCFDVPALRNAFGCTDLRKAQELQRTLQGHIEHVAKSLQVDTSLAVCEYRQVALLILDLTSPGRPLATATNNQVWQAMLEPNVRLSHLPQRSAMQALHFLIRFYISVEDGECAVERDLGLLTSVNHAHQNVNSDLADDLLVLRSDPIEFSDICGDEIAVDGSSPQLSVVGSCPRLGSKSRRWATLWRGIYGARLGCYRKTAQGKRGKRSGTYAAAKRGVLAAAEYAVAVNMHTRREHEQEADSLTPLGVSKSFLKSALGDKAAQYNNEKMKRFQALTDRKKQSCPRFMGRFLASENPWKERKAAKSPQKLQNIRQVCFVGEIGQSLPHPVADGRGLKEVHGRNRCLRADLAVVDDLSRIFDCADDATVNQVLSIVGRGVPVVTRTSWVLAKGDPEHIPKESVIRHVPLVETTKVVFEYTDHFKAREGNLVGSIKELSKLPKSQWKVRNSSVSAVGDSSVSAVGERGHSIMTLSADGVDTLRSWIGEHRRIVNVSGPKAWSLTAHFLTQDLME